MSNKKTLHLRTNVKDNKPSSAILDHGAIAINYHKESPTMFIKDSEDNVVEFKDKNYFENIITENELVVATVLTTIKDNVGLNEDCTYKPSENTTIIKDAKTITEATELLDEALSNVGVNSNLMKVTYSKLVSLRDNSKLKPGCWYRITDYITTTSQENTMSAGHQFDVLVLATDVNVLSEEARAINHEEEVDPNKPIRYGSEYVGAPEYNNLYLFEATGESVVAQSGITYWVLKSFYVSGSEVTEIPAGNACVTTSNPPVVGEPVYMGENLEEALEATFLNIGEPIAENTDYFESCNLNAWKIWYCLDNDESRFAWTDEINGKGVIYRMIDEWNNDCPYDFKNIKFDISSISGSGSSGSGSASNIAVGEFDAEMTNVPEEENTEELTELLDASEIIYYYTFDLNTNSDNSLVIGYCHDNIIKEHIKSGLMELNRIVFKSVSENKTVFGNTFGVNCFDMIFGNNCNRNLFSSDCYNNSFGNDCFNNTFGNDCNKNTFGDECVNNSFGNNCYNNSFGKYCYNNSFGDGCENNTFSSSSSSNSLGNSCSDNLFDNSCNYNSLGHYCRYNRFGVNCNYNSFGNGCDYNSFGENCYSNSFGNGCDNNTFGNVCEYNTFSNDCKSNSFGKYCGNNSFGDECDFNSFRMYSSKDGTLRSHCYYNIFENGVRYVVLYNTNTASTSYKLQNVTVCQGMSGIYDNNNIVEIPTLNPPYQIKVAKNSVGDIKVYCEADLIN